MIDRLETIPGRLKADWAVKLAPLLDVKPKSLIFPEGESETSFASGRIPEGAESDNPEPSNLRSLENIEEHLVHFAEWAILSVGRESLALATDDQVRLWLRELVGLYEAHLIEQQRIAEVRKRVLTQAEPRTSPPEHGRGKDQK